MMVRHRTKPPCERVELSGMPGTDAALKELVSLYAEIVAKAEAQAVSDEDSGVPREESPS